MRSHRPAVFSFLVLLMVPTLANADEPDRKYLLEQVDDAAVVQVYADGFADLLREQKLLIWHLYQAGLAGRDIYYDQRYAESLAMRRVLEAILTHPDGVDAETLREITRYTKLFWINSGPFNNLTARKFVLKCKPEDLAKAAHAAQKAGASIRTRPGQDLDALLKHLEPRFFDPNFEPIVTNKSPGPGKDILLSSANNLYQGVSMDDLKGFTETYPLNSRLVNRNGNLEEQPYRIDDHYSARIKRIVGHLEDAITVAPEPTAKALKALVKFYKSGSTRDREAYDIAWVQDNQAPVDTINGFIEVYMDPRGVKGSWESAVFYVNKHKTEAIQKIAAEAPWFEAHMPWKAEYRKKDVKGITANAIDVVIESGDCGPITPIGINLPNDQSIREQYGSKSVSLSNIIEAYDRSMPTSFREEFSWTPEEAARSEKWSSLGQDLLVNMHEVIGHASGKLSDDLKGQPQDSIKEYYSALEEGRADLVALYYLPDPKLAELGLVSADDQAEMALAAYESYARNALVQLRRVREGNQLEEDHMRNRQMVVHWLMANTPAIKVQVRDGKTFYVVTSTDAFRDGVARLLAEVQRIKSEGDYKAAESLFTQHGIYFDPKVRDAILSRVEKLNLPSYTGFVFPKLTPIKGDDGQILDIQISYPQDLKTQMLEFSGATKK